MEQSLDLPDFNSPGERSPETDPLHHKPSTVSRLKAQFERQHAEEKLPTASNGGRCADSIPRRLSLGAKDQASQLAVTKRKSPQKCQETEPVFQLADRAPMRSKSLNDADPGPAKAPFRRTTTVGCLVERLEGHSTSLSDATFVPANASLRRATTVESLAGKLKGQSEFPSDANLLPAKSPLCSSTTVGSPAEKPKGQWRGGPSAAVGQESTCPADNSSPGSSPAVSPADGKEGMQISPFAALKAKFERQSNFVSPQRGSRMESDPVKRQTSASGEAAQKTRTKPRKGRGFASVSVLKEQFEHGHATSAPLPPPVSPVGELAENVRRKKEMLSTVDIVGRYGRDYQEIKRISCAPNGHSGAATLKDDKGDKGDSFAEADCSEGNPTGELLASEGAPSVQEVSVSHHVSHKIEALAMQVGAVALNFAKSPPPRFFRKKTLVLEDGDGEDGSRRAPQTVGGAAVPVGNGSQVTGTGDGYQQAHGRRVEESKREDCEHGVSVALREETQSPAHCSAQAAVAPSPDGIRNGTEGSPLV